MVLLSRAVGDPRAPIGSEQLQLGFDFSGGAGTNINVMEGSLRYRDLGLYYAVWPRLKAFSQCGLLRMIGPDTLHAVQCWVRTDENAPFPERCVSDPLTGWPVTEEFPACTSCP